MTTDQPSLIAPPPSVGDVLTSLTSDAPRIGRVDFSTRLAAETRARADRRAAETGEGGPAAEPGTHDLLVADRPEPEVPDEQPTPAPEAAAPAPEPEATAAEAEPEAEPQPEAEAQPATPAMTEAPAAPEAPIAAPVEVPVTLVAVEPPPALVAEAAPAAPTPARLEVNREAARDVTEVAEVAVDRMRIAESAALQHLAALEAEATRRCDLVTAQAELDAELIRLHARREAHAIITAARMRAGERALDEDARVLSRVGDALAQVAGATERVLGSSPAPERPEPR